MFFQHTDALWADFPELVAGVVTATESHPRATVGSRLAGYTRRAAERLADGPESELPEIQAWRQAMRQMGLKPTQYRCAAEALLRRFRRDGSLPGINPLVDLCNAVSLAYALPVAAFDVAQVTDWLQVGYARGDEHYLTFADAWEHPDPGEVIFADAVGHCHARRWTNRQSGASAVRDHTHTVLIVVEGLHDSAAADVPAAVTQLAEELRAGWSTTPAQAILDRGSPRFDLPELVSPPAE